MAAYAALVSLMHIIDQIQHHLRPPISLDKEQVESLTENITFLQELLEGYSHVAGYRKEADALESRIADAAYAAEDVIESRVVDQILAGSTSGSEEFIGDDGVSSSLYFYQDLQKVIEDMDRIKKDVMETREKMGEQDRLQRSSTPAGSLRSPSTRQNTMVGLDDVLLEVMDRLTGGQLDLQVIPIVGMGGIGKTTLTRNIYMNPLIEQRFDICAWATISQEYDTREILREVLGQIKEVGRGDSREMSENELGETLYKHLSGRRYLIVMDDMWNIAAWDKIKFFFPNYNNGSRIIVTTRLKNLAIQLTDSYSLEMGFLDDDKSWNLFSKIVFGDECCPLELDEIGRKITKSCKGLPLSIAVIGGLLAKSKHTREYWEHIAENLNSIVNSEGSECCLQILHMSYNQLPVYLKSCFLYMGVFSEDSVIQVSMLIKLWVAEGFLKPISGKSLEETAEKFFKELIDRNLILVHELGSTGNIKYSKIHDLIRDLCLREAQKERFYNITSNCSLNCPQGVNAERRIVIPNGISKNEVIDALQSMTLARSLISDIEGVLSRRNFRLLRILKVFDLHSYKSGMESLRRVFELVNTRYIWIRIFPISKFPSSVYLMWNLQTLIVRGIEVRVIAPDEIWKMPQLRHVDVKEQLYLPDPPRSDGQDYIVLGNLQTLKTIENFKCDEEVIERIPNIKKMGIEYCEVEESSQYYLNSFHGLHKLESFQCSSMPSGIDFLLNLTFPLSLKKLTLQGWHVHWEDILQKIGSLPLLEKLKLRDGSFGGKEWETVEGQFCRLKFLLIHSCRLKYWKITDNAHFPCLEHLVLVLLGELEEIPSVIGEIPTLQSIELKYCSNSAVISAKQILDDQEELGNVGLQVRVSLGKVDKALESLASPNFQVRRL